MIINIRGTSGSGKSTVMRRVMSEMTLQPHSVPGRRNPLFYTARYRDRRVAVLGHYESECGGCDTINSYSTLTQLIRDLTAKGESILMEGLLLSEDTKQTLSLGVEDLRVLFLTTPIERCLDNVKRRRLARGNNKPFNPTNTSRRVTTILRAREKLESAGVSCYSVSFHHAHKLILHWLGE